MGPEAPAAAANGRAWYTALTASGPAGAGGDAGDLRRGVPLSNLFRGFGRVIRIRADTLPPEELEALYDLSTSVGRFDFFLSQCWGSSGLHKYVTLVLDQLGLAALAAGGTVASALCLYQTFIQELPRSADFYHYDKVYALGWTISFWEFGLGLAAAWLVLAFGHVLCRRTCCFLDCASICQTDSDMKVRGIAHIPDWIRDSKEMVVLWDEKYFTRLWCIYEVAVVQSAGLPIRLLPMGVYVCLAVGQVYYAMCCLSYLVLSTEIKVQAGIMLSSLLCHLPTCMVDAQAGRVYARLLSQLQEQLDSFDVRCAAIFSEADRVLINRDIEKLYCGSLDNFNVTIRTSLKAGVLESLSGQRAMVPYGVLLRAFLPVVPFVLSLQSCVAGHPLPFTMTHIIMCTDWVLFQCPLCTAAVMEIGKRISLGRDGSGMLGALKCWCAGALVGTLWTVASNGMSCCIMCVGAGQLSQRGVPAWAAVPMRLVMLVCNLAATAWAFGPGPAGADSPADGRLPRACEDQGPPR